MSFGSHIFLAHFLPILEVPRKVFDVGDDQCMKMLLECCGIDSDGDVMNILIFNPYVILFMARIWDINPAPS